MVPNFTPLVSRASNIFRIGYFPWVGIESTSKLKKKCLKMEKVTWEAGIE
jgi:hypothetical protein